MRRHPARGSRRLLAAGLAFALLAGCTDDTRTGDAAGTLPQRPVAYHPEQFPDIPFERLVGYRLTAADRQLAVAVAGGALRRLSLVFISRPDEDPPKPQVELDRLAGGLATGGWRQVAGEPSKDQDAVTGRWTRNDETLEIVASIEGASTIITLRLIPR